MKMTLIIMLTMFFYSCSIDINETFYDVTALSGAYDNNIYQTKKTMFYIENLPKDHCVSRDCTYLTNARLVKTENNCGNCISEDRVSTLIRLRLLPKGSKLKVIGTSLLRPKGFLNSAFNSNIRYLQLEDESGFKSEMSELEFEMDIVNQRFDKTVDFDNSFEQVKNQIATNQFFKVWKCLDLPMNEYNKKISAEFERFSLNRLSHFYKKFGPIIELKLASFVNSFKLEDKLQINWVEVLHKNSGTKDKNIDAKYSCGEFEFKSIESYLLAYYYFNEWGIHSFDYVKQPGSNKLCLLEKDNVKSNSCFDVTDLKELDFNHVKSYSETEILKYRRDELN